MQQVLITNKQISKYKNFTLLDVGEKAYYLIMLKHHAELKEFVPNFHLITSYLFLNIIKEITNLTDNIENFHKVVTIQQLDKLINHVLNKLEIKTSIQKLFKINYSKGIAIRPSTIVLKKGLKSTSSQILSGLFPTYLNISNSAEILLILKKIIKYILSQEVFNYLQINNLSIKDLSIAFILQEMIIPEVSGIIYPYNPITLNTNQMIIEAVFGLGNSLSKGEIIPDTYIINKKNLQILEKKITPQTWMYIPKPSKHTLEQTQKVELSDMTKYIQKLDDNNIQKLAKISKELNRNFRKSFLIEYSVIGNKSYILQLKNINTLKEKQNKIHTTKLENTPIIQGVSIYSKGEIIGSVYKTKFNNKEILYPNKKFILVTNNLDQKELIKLSKEKNLIGIIFDLVPSNSDLAFLLKKLKIPSIGQTYNATKILKNNIVIKMDSKTGFIYKISITKKQRNIPQNPKQNTTTVQNQINLIKLFNFIYPGIATDISKKVFIYFSNIADIKNITNIINNNPASIHVLTYPHHIQSKTLLKNYERIIQNTSNNTKAYIVENFIELNNIIRNIQHYTIDTYIIINMTQLADSIKRQSILWYKNKEFIQLIRPFMKILRSNPNLKIIDLNKNKPNKKNKHYIQILINLGFIGAIIP